MLVRDTTWNYLEVGSISYNYPEFLLNQREPQKRSRRDRHEAPARIRVLLAGKSLGVNFERLTAQYEARTESKSFPPSDFDQGRLI
jgi:hypothetical protein